jgi:S-adenosylmethionine decarboxylase
MSKGYHIIADLFGCSPEHLESSEALREILLDAASNSGFSIVGESFYQFQPKGATGVLLLETSHMCAHSWPENEFLALDIYSCNGKEKAKKALEYILDKVKPEKAAIKEIERFR